MYNRDNASPKKTNNQTQTNLKPFAGSTNNNYKQSQHQETQKAPTINQEELINAEVYLKHLLSTFLSQINPEDEKEENSVILTTQQKINSLNDSMNHKEYKQQTIPSSLHLSNNEISSFEYKDSSELSSTRKKIFETDSKKRSKKEDTMVNISKIKENIEKTNEKENLSEKTNLISKNRKSTKRLNSTKLNREKTIADVGLNNNTFALKKKFSLMNPQSRKSQPSLKNIKRYIDYDNDKISVQSKNTKKDHNNNEVDIQNVKGLTKANRVELERICQELKINICNSEFDTINELSSFKNYPELSKAEKKIYLNDITSCSPSSKSKEEQKYRCLLRKNYVYDSLDDEEIEDEIDVSFVIPSNSKLIFLFDFLVFGSVASTYIFTPYSLAFHYSTHKEYCLIELVFEFIFDILLSCDMVLRFFREVNTIDDMPIIHLPDIAKKYLFSFSFLFDFIAALPFNSYIVYQHNIKEKENSLFPLDFYMPRKLFQLLRLIRMIKIITIFLHNVFLKRAFKKFIHIHHFSQWSRLYLSIVIFFITVHILASIFIFIGKLNHPSWISIRREDNRKSALYVDAVYYILSSIYSIGYGDVVSISFSERIYNLFLLIFGVMIYSWGLSSISTYVQTHDAKTLDYNHKLNILDDIKITHEKMPYELYNKVCRFLYYRMKNEKKDKNSIVNSLPIGLRNNLIWKMYKPIIDNFTFFKNFDNTEFIVRIILALRPLYGLKDDILVKEGDFIEEIIFVKKGNLSLQLPLPDLTHLEQRKSCICRRKFMMNPRIKESLLNLEKNNSYFDTFSMSFATHDNMNDCQNDAIQYIKIMEIRTNEHFGDVLMFLNRRSPLTMKVKSKIVDMFYLKKTDAVEISMGYPSIWHKINKKSLFNMEQIDRLINKAIKLFFLSNQRQLFALIKEKNKQTLHFPFKEIMKSKKIAELYAIVNNSNSCELKSIPSGTYSQSNNSENIINLTEDSAIDNKQTKKKMIDEIIEERDSENTVELKIEDEKMIVANSIQYKNPFDLQKESVTELTHISFDNNSNTNSNFLCKKNRITQPIKIFEIHLRESFTIQSSYSNFNEYNNYIMSSTIQLMNLLIKHDRNELVSLLKKGSSKTIHLKVPKDLYNMNSVFIRSNSYEAKKTNPPVLRNSVQNTTERNQPEERILLNQKEISKWKFNQAKTHFFNRADLSEESSGKLGKINRKSSLYEKRNNNSSGVKTHRKLNKIKENIEMNALNLNNPDLFYSEYFQKVMSKEQHLIAKQELLKRLDYTEKLICEYSSSNESNIK